LDLIKGLGGALLREKIVAMASDRLVIVADAAKLVEQLGASAPVPVEVVRFGWETTADRLAALGGNPVMRRDAKGRPYHTDGGNLILDCAVKKVANPARLDRELLAIPGVVGTGIFIAMADVVLVAEASGKIRVLKG